MLAYQGNDLTSVLAVVPNWLRLPSAMHFAGSQWPNTFLQETSSRKVQVVLSGCQRSRQVQTQTPKSPLYAFQVAVYQMWLYASGYSV
jgi:hypothetical protein